MTRKVFVLGYRLLNEDEIVPLNRPGERLENIGVRYTAEPRWTLYDRQEAVRECDGLKAMGVHIGDHYCDFAIERLKSGEHAIVCRDHPADLALAASLGG